MLAASKCPKLIPRVDKKLGILIFSRGLERDFCPNFRNGNLFGRQPLAKRRWSFNKRPNRCLLISSPLLQLDRYYQRITRTTFIPVAVSWMWPFSCFMNNSFGIYQSMATEASCTEQEVADDVLNQILSAIENDPHSSREICTTFIDKLVRARNLSASTKLLQSLRSKRIFLSPNAYNLLLAAAGEGNDIDLVFQIFKDLLVSCESMSSTSYFCLAKAFMNQNDYTLLLRFVKEVSELTFPRSATVLNRIIFAFAECGQIDKAMLIFDHMKSLKCKPDLVTYNTILVILGRLGHIDEMLHEFACMKASSIIPDIISYNTLLNSLRKVGRLDLCLVFLKEMRERGMEPDLRTYTALIEGFGRSGNIEESLRLFNEMKDRFIRPSIYIYRSLINNLKKMGKLDSAMSLLEEMNTHASNLVGPKDFKRKKR